MAGVCLLHLDYAMIPGDKVRGGLGTHRPSAPCPSKRRMRTLTRSLLARLTIALAIVLAVLTAPTGSSAFHDAAAVGHAVLADADAHKTDHGHSHDIDEASDEAAQLPSHGGDHHKHNPGDHSHEKLGTLPALMALGSAPLGRHVIATCDPKVHGLSTSFLRPPRPSDIA